MLHLSSPTTVSLMIPGINSSVYGFLSIHPKLAVSDDPGMLYVMFLLYFSPFKVSLHFQIYFKDPFFPLE